MKQESKNNESRCSVQSSSVTNQQAINTNSTKITQVQGSNQVAVQQNLVNWKWVVIDPVRFKDYPIPCIIRHTDSVKEYVSVRIVEKVILSKFEANLSEEAKNFGVLTTFFCTSDEIFTLNDINENHVDRLYGNEKFKIDIDTLVCLKTFLEFYEIIQRTVCFKNDLNQAGQNKLHHYQQQQQHQHLQLQQQQHQLQLQQNLHHQQQHIQQHQHQHQQQHQKQQQQQLHLQRAQSIQNFRMPLPRAAASVGYQQFIQNYPNQLSQRLVQRLPNFSQYNNSNQSNPNHFVNFMPNMINNLKATQINPMQHKLVQIVGAAPGQALPIIQATPTSLNHMTNLRNHNQNLISCLNSNQIQTSLQQTNPSLSIIDASMRNHPPPNTTMRNLTPPLTPLASMVSNLANDAHCNNVQPYNAQCSNVQPNNAQCSNVQPNNAHCNNVQPNNAQCSNVQPSNVQPSNVQPSNVQPKNVQPNNAQCSNVQLSAAREEKKSAVKKEEKLNRLDTSTDIFLIDDDQLNKSMEACDQSIDETAIDFNDETYGFVQVNDKILLYIDVEDAIYRYNRCLPKCSKHVLLVHLIKQLNVNCEMNDLKKNLKIKIIENNERIKNLIKWFNQKHAPMSLDVVTEAQLELVNIIQFQNVYAKEAIFFKNLHYFNQAGIDYYAEYNKVLCMQGGFVYVPIENKRNIRPFVRLGDQLLVSCNLVELVSKSLYSNRSEMETEKVTFDLRKDFKLIEQINEFCRLQTFYLSLHANKDFRKKNTQFFNLKKYLSLFPDNFKIFCQFDSNFPKSWLNDLDKIDKHNNKQSTLNTEHIPVDHTQTSDEAANNGQESVYMSPRSDDQSALQTISMALLNKKNSNQFSQEDFKHKPRLRSYSESTVLLKFSNKFKKLIKYKYLFRKRNSCTALQFLNRDQLIAKDHLLNNQVLTYMDKILEKKNIEKKLSKKDKIQTSIPIEIKQEKIHSYNQLEQPEFKELPSTSSCCSQNVCSPKTNQKSKVSPHTPPTIESLKKELQIKTKSKHSANDCSFLIDSPSQSKTNKQIKRKNSKIVDEFRKRARLIGQQKELHELKKDLSFLVPDDRIMPLSENEHFNFVPKKMAQPKNLLAIKQADQTDLYSTDSFDENFYIKKYNVNANSKVVVEKIDIGKYLKRMNQVKKVKRKKCKNAQKSDKLSKSLSSKTTSACNSADFSSNENLFRKPSKKNVLLVESDDEDQLPRLDLDYSKL